MGTESESLVMSVPEAGRMLGICRDSAYAAVKTGALPAIRLGKRIVVSRAVIERMLNDTLPLPNINEDNEPRTA